MAGNARAREAVFALRREIARIEGRPAERLEPALPAGGEAEPSRLVMRRDGIASLPLLETGACGFDAALGGGIPLPALTEIHARQTRDAGAATGFVLGLCRRLAAGPDRPLLWIGTRELFRETGLPHAQGIHGFGMAPEALLLSQAGQVLDALWIAEEAAVLPTFAAVILELRGNPRKLDLTATRRLHRRAQEAGRPVFLLRDGAETEPTAAPLRLIAGPAPAGRRHILSGVLEGSIGPPAFAVTLSKSRSPAAAEFILEWNSDERAFSQREAADGRRAPHPRAMVPPSGHGAHPPAPAGQVVALRGAA